MPIVDFESLPDSARIWVYGADRDLSPEAGQKLLESVDDFLSRWAAHGVPLHNARRWDENRFLTIGVDSTKEGASGCSIDVLYRALKALQPELGANVVTSGLVYYRDRDGHLQSVTRDEFGDLAAKGVITGDTEVYDLSVTSLNEWRSRFRSRAADSWHAALMPEASAKS